MNLAHKIVPLSSLERIVKDPSAKRVLAGGCFDILHIGHVQFIAKAKEAGDSLILLLESSEFIEQVKKKKPVHTQEQRADILASLQNVDYVVPLPFLTNPNSDYERIIRALSPAVIALTEGDKMEAQKRKLAQLVGSEVLVISPISSFSSSQLITYAPIFRD